MKALSKVQYIVGPKGEKKAVVLDFQEFQKLLEDYHDLKVVAARRQNIKIPASEFIARLKKHGTL